MNNIYSYNRKIILYIRPKLHLQIYLFPILCRYIPHFIVLNFTTLQQIVNFLLQIEGLWQPCIEQVCQHHFSNSICSLHVSVSHFGNSHNISNVFIIIIFVMVICDQRSLILLLELFWGATNHAHIRHEVNI